MRALPSLAAQELPAPVLAGLAKEKFNKIREMYGAYMSDPLEVLTYPTLNDPCEQTTAAFTRAYAAASDLFNQEDTPEDVLYDASLDVEAAWGQAWYKAKTVGDSALGERERTAVRKAHALLSRALDSGASPFERQASYLKAKELLVGVVTLPRAAYASIERPLRQLES
jgi:hypothetical protein